MTDIEISRKSKKKNMWGLIWKMYADENVDKEKEKVMLRMNCREYKYK